MFLLALAVGVVLAAVGGDRFVKGAVGLSAALRVPPGIIAATVAAFSTSSPELAVAVLSAIDGRPEIALGDALGSNMVNLGVVLGGTALLTQLTARWADVRRDVPVALGSLVALAALGADGSLSRTDGVVLLAFFVSWIVRVTFEARRERSVIEADVDAQWQRAARSLAVGVAALLVAGQLIVSSAKGFGELLGWDEFVVGTLLVAIGTSTPELVTALLAARRGHAEVGVGVVLGSNVFNSMLIVGVAAVIDAISIDAGPTRLALVLTALATIVAVPGRRGEVTRGRGVILVALYAVWVALVLAQV